MDLRNANKVTIWSLAQVNVLPDGLDVAASGASSTGVVLHGVQSVTLDTTYNQDDVFELGQLERYEAVEQLPDVTSTIEKVLDGGVLVYHAATQPFGSKSPEGPDLWRRAANYDPCQLKFLLFSHRRIQASGLPEAVVTCSGMYIDNLTYRFPVEGNYSESVSFTGSSKIWATGQPVLDQYNNGLSGIFDPYQTPDTVNPPKDIERRHRLVPWETRMPTTLPGVKSDGTIDDWGYMMNVHIGDIDITADIGRTPLTEQFKWSPYFRRPNFPITVTTNIEVIATEYMDLADALATEPQELPNEKIVLTTSGYYRFHVGDTNVLRSVNWANTDTGGGEFRVRFSYQSYNELTVTDPANDPAGFPHKAI